MIKNKTQWMIILLFFIFIPLAATLESGSEEIFFLENPAVSPDGKKVVFSYEEDLWIVPIEGGNALRLTGMEGQESQPRFSPDGKWLAFSNSQIGNNDVYIMPLEGGPIRRLTFHQGNDRVDSWSWDSKYIYFNSDRHNNFTTFKVAATGGTPIRVFSHFFNTIHNLEEHPINKSYYFTDTWESQRFPERKRYKGAYNPDIKSYNPKTGEFTVHTSYPGKDLWISIDKKGRIYFASDRKRDQYNLYTFKDKVPQQLTDFSTSIKNPRVSANGEIIVFEKDYQLYRFQTKTGKTNKIPVSLVQNRKLAIDKAFNINKEKISYFDVSPDGKKFAVVSRGELFVSDIKGQFIRRIPTHPRGRVVEVKWLMDNVTLVYNQAVDGWLNLYHTRADQKSGETQITFDTANNRQITLNKKRTKALYFSGRNRLKIMNLLDYKSKTIVEDEFWGFYNDPPYFSPQDRYVVYTAYRNFEADIFFYETATGKTINITDSGVSEREPFWSHDGKYLFFSADRFTPNYPRGGAATHIYKLPLEKYDRPFRIDEYRKLFKSPTPAKTKKENKIPAQGEVIKPNLESLTHRWERISTDLGSQTTPYVIGDEKTTHVFFLQQSKQFNRFFLYKTTIEPFKKNKTVKIKNVNTDSILMVNSNKKYYALISGVINQLDISANSVKPISIALSFNRNLSDEFQQMFYEVWANLQENYYDETFHGIDWEKTRDNYSRFLPHLRNRSNLRTLIRDMLGELNSSHLGFTSRGKEEETYHRSRSLHTGIIFHEDKPYTVKNIVKDSAADKKGIIILPGDVLTAVNDKTLDKKINREYYFSSTSNDEEIELTFTRGQKTYKVLIHPESNKTFTGRLYEEWIQFNQDYVDKKSSNRIAYIHMKDMGQEELNRFIIEMTTEAYKKDALILDLRYNRGGNVHDAVLNFLSQRPYTQWKYRGGKYAPQPSFAPSAKPIILLINQQSLSDAEMTAAGFKALKLGKIIGTETYRWLIFTSGKNLVDGSFYRLPSWGCYTLDGKDIEWQGVKPDIQVNTTFKDRLGNRDPQLDKAIEEIQKELK